MRENHNDSFKARMEDILDPTKMVPLIVLLAVCLWIFWYFEAGNIDYRNVVGEYAYHDGPITAELQLLADHTYKERLEINGARRETSGTWELFPSDSQNHIAFRSNFVVLPSEQTLSTDGTAYGIIENWFGFLSVSLESDNANLIFRKDRFTNHL